MKNNGYVLLTCEGTRGHQYNRQSEGGEDLLKTDPIASMPVYFKYNFEFFIFRKKKN
jgi:hypothetical protein